MFPRILTKSIFLYHHTYPVYSLLFNFNLNLPITAVSSSQHFVQFDQRSPTKEIFVMKNCDLMWKFTLKYGCIKRWYVMSDLVSVNQL